MQENTVFEGNLRDRNIVQKSEPLLLMRSVPFELGELKVLDTYLSRINSHDPTSVTVTFTKAEYEELMGLNNVDMRTLKKYTKSMLQKVVELPMTDGYVQFTLFTCAACKKDEYGRQVIALSCSEQAKQVFFNIEKLGYLQYELKNILSLTSKYSFLLYLYLRKERYRVTWEIPLKELREKKLDLKNNEYYSNFKYFKRDILDKAVKEVNGKTDVEFKYETVKKGRAVAAIRFIYCSNSEIGTDTDPNQITIDDYMDEQEKDLWETAVEELKFSRGQLDELRELLVVVPDDKLPLPPVGINSIEIRRYHYMAIKAKEIQNRDAAKKIKSKFAYLKKIMQNDFK